MEKVILAGALIAGAYFLTRKQDDSTGGNTGYAIPEGIFGNTPTQSDTLSGQAAPQIFYNLAAPIFPHEPQAPFSGIQATGGYMSPPETKKEARLTGLPPQDTYRNLGEGHPYPPLGGYSYNPTRFNIAPATPQTARATYIPPTTPQPKLTAGETAQILKSFAGQAKKEAAIKDLYATYTPQPLKLPEYTPASKKEAKK